MKRPLFKRLLAIFFALLPLVSAVGCSPAQKSENAGEEAQTIRIIDDNYRNYYEIFVSSFYDSDGDGTGDLDGVAQKLDYLNDGNDETDGDLGFNGIWLMPIMPSPSYHKYDVTDFCSIDPAYGTLEDFEALLSACHERGIRLIIDFPFNHTSSEHPWFLQAVTYYESLEAGAQPDYGVCPYAAYYHFSTEKAGAMNWYPAGTSGWYYEGVFTDQMPDLALENEQVRAEIEQAAAFWLNLGVDGFRLDAVKEYVSGSPAANVEILSWFSDYAKSVNPDVYLVGEAWETNAVTLSTYYESGMTSFFDFPLAQATGSVAIAVNRGTGESLAALFSRAQEVYGAVDADFIDAPFLSNHDTSRISAHYVNDARKMKFAAGLLLTMNGSPFVYYGEELGMNSRGTKDENKRLPMHWSDVDLTGTPLAPAGADEVEQKFPALDEQIGDPTSIYNYYKQALRIRNENPGIARGTMETAGAFVTDTVCAITKTYQGSTLLLLYNLGEETETVSLGGTDYEAFSLCGSLNVDETEITLADGVLTLPSFGIAVLKP